MTGFSVLSTLSPLSYQVASQLKTIITLGLSVLLLGEQMNGRQMTGFALSICGIAAYSLAKENSPCALELTVGAGVQPVTPLENGPSILQATCGLNTTVDVSHPDKTTIRIENRKGGPLLAPGHLQYNSVEIP